MIRLNNEGLPGGEQKMVKSSERVAVSRRGILLGLAGGTALSVWHKPLVNAVLLPAHAQASVCPMIVIGNVVFGPVSGSPNPPVCTTTFDVLSGDAGVSLTVSSVTTSTLAANVVVDVQDLGTATSTMGPRVVWRGPATDAPSCSDLTPTDEVTFTVTATCGAAGGGTFTQDFTLSEILA